MAWAERLQSGRYRGVYRDAGGRRRSAGTYAHKAKAIRAAGAMEERARRSQARDPDSKLTWGAWAEDWWASRGVEPSTAKVDGYRKARHLDPKWGGVPLARINSFMVEEWAAELRSEGLGPASVRRVVRLFGASLEAATRDNLLESNPVTKGVVARLPSEPPASERFLTRDEYAAIRDELPSTEDQLVADVLVFTGLRWGEMAGMHWERVDLEAGMLYVMETFDASVSRIKAYPKGRRARQVPLTPELVAGLGEAREQARDTECGLPHSSGRCRSGLVLTTERGQPLRTSNWSNRVWHPAVERAGVGHVRPHDLRHTFASWLLQAGVPLAEVSKVLGHKSVTVTERYAKLQAKPSPAILAALASAPDLPHAVSGGVGSAQVTGV